LAKLFDKLDSSGFYEKAIKANKYDGDINLEQLNGLQFRPYKKKLFSISLCSCLILTLLISCCSWAPSVSARQTFPSDFHSSSVSNVTQQKITSDNVEAKLLANNLENMLNQSASILGITSNFLEMKNTPYANSISPNFHGIPKNVDLAKRHIAQSILSKDKALSAIFFAMRNGDVYLIEPYARQHNLTVNNLAFRDYFKGL
jgi:hypothetical protein